MERVEVLDRVKGLLLLPNTELATTQQVADFYEVGKHVISMILSRHKDEIISDGMVSIKGKDLVVNNKLRTKSHKGHYKLDDGTTIAYGVSNYYPRRAILRVGMLLRDSEVAKEVRTQLLNIEEKVTTEVKTVDLNEEDRLQAEVGKAVASGDFMAVLEANTKLNNFKNRHIKEIEEKLQITEMEKKINYTGTTCHFIQDAVLLNF
ncbi:hypothetical protein H9655_02735 [Cytobacillus sp. Sa5YUA1]|uniref:Uncharacterized protein n=1 Tax=Cytobacillus stercorigallinarum TaxID=2762240 RepID=A0ABR8QKA6_9BACI|nr:hypothetical protein [Cytobacillus stercorigallinarum]MBD7935933.1 hypothetical protein [Cytobacillus stercorigallinarum]